MANNKKIPTLEELAAILEQTKDTVRITFNLLEKEKKTEYLKFMFGNKHTVKEVMQLLNINPTQLKEYGYNIDGSPIRK